eukprot:COSAG05_NODE_573_length_8601_cov_58.330981_14_plen_78_part_00
MEFSAPYMYSYSRTEPARSAKVAGRLLVAEKAQNRRRLLLLAPLLLRARLERPPRRRPRRARRQREGEAPAWAKRRL